MDSKQNFDFLASVVASLFCYLAQYMHSRADNNIQLTGWDRRGALKFFGGED